MSESTMSTRSLLSSALSKLSNTRPADLKNALPARRDLRPGENGYVDGGSRKQTWKQWAGEKVRGMRGETVSTERISLFPGWATRRYMVLDAPSYPEFTVQIFVSGFVTSHRPPEYATRAQKAFLRMARSFAALPRLPGQLPSDPPAISAAEADLMYKKPLPSPPSDIPDDYEVQTLEASLRLLAEETEEKQENDDEEEVFDVDNPSSSTPSSVASSYASTSSVSPSTPTGSDTLPGPLPAAVRRMHANLEARLEPFWTTSLSGRVVRISVYTSPIVSSGDDERLPAPLMSQDALTGPDGFFHTTIVIPWTRLCSYNLSKTLADRSREHEFYVRTELLPPPPPQTASSASYYTPNAGYRSHDTHSELPSSAIHVLLTHAPLRVISDIDDTVKLSNILKGARAVFQNVFVKELEDVVIPGMSEWYMEMWKRGVRFHYVSNGPFELLPIINDFLQISHLPSGSIKLRSYGGRSLFNGLLSTPAARKRSGVLDVLNAFSESQFLLVGDTGEQDLELYSLIAAELPHQIIGIFIRDVTADENAEPVDDPTGQDTYKTVSLDRDKTVKAARGGKILTITPLSSATRPHATRTVSDSTSSPLADPTPKATRVQSLNIQPPSTPPTPSSDGSDYFGSPTTPTFTPNFSTEPQAEYTASMSSGASSTSSSRRSTRIRIPGSSRQNSLAYAVSEAERKRQELQQRIYRARIQVPSHIHLRIFRRPEECAEAFEILGRLQHD